MDVGGNVDQGEVVVFQSHDVTRPTAPTIRGPRRTKSVSRTYLLSSQDPDNTSDELVYRCAFDATRLHACSTHLRQRLRVGSHVLRAQASDQTGNLSPVTLLRLLVVR
jgi:hypothetical protein